MSSIICCLCQKRLKTLKKIFSIKSRNYSQSLETNNTKINVKNKSKNNRNQYSNTVLLPKSNYPMKHSRNLELEQNEKLFSNLIKDLKENKDKPVFTLHDGPPYANGSTHFGHSINKILKDIICRRKLLEGFRVCFSPGWDCHGLPIELKAINHKNHSLKPIEIRQKAKQLALNVIEEQKKSFMSWGLIAEWDNPYFTFDSVYIMNQMNAFYELFEKGLVFRDYMPVYWSPSTQTALAEAELQYNENHISKSVYVKFKLIDLPLSIKHFGDVYALIWTTTPWTLPANEAIAYATNQTYAIITVNKLSQDFLIVAKDLISSLENHFNSKIEIKQEFNGSELNCVKYTNPIGFQSESLPFIESQYVTITKGTGLVHIAPNHGFDDYKLMTKYKFPLKECIVDGNGCYVLTHNTFLDKKYVLKEGNDIVMNLLGNSLLFKEDFTHSYPYDWRSGEPVIMRASPQWFLNIETIREDCIEALQNVKFYPEFFKNQFINQLRIRPNWCISRQRSWGVPIPVFYTKSDKALKTPVLTKQLSNHILKLFEEKGYDCWWQLSNDQLLPKGIIDNNLSCDDLVKGNDIFDIWFDSGMSWKTALNEPKVADIYLEGVDQLRGWFQSSLILSVALRNCSPYKSIFIHGFAVDKDGKKMSKSIGNVIDPNSIIENDKNPTNNCGSDGLRFWIALNASNYENVKVSLNSFDETLICINKIRNIIRFIIGSLHEFNVSEHVCNFDEMNILDKYVMHLLHNYLNEMKYSYENLKIGRVISKSIEFIFSDVSAFYCSRIKHRLYCGEKYSQSRRSCQTVLLHIYNSIIHELSPILPHIMIEANNHLPINKDFIINKDEWNRPDIEQSMKLLLSIIDAIYEKSEIKHLIEYDCYIKVLDPECFKNLSLFQSECDSSDSELCEILQMSSISYGNSQFAQNNGFISINEERDEIPYQLYITSAKKHLCNRCRRYTAVNTTQPCVQCLNVLSSQWS